jgi:hypothetical protein
LIAYQLSTGHPDQRTTGTFAQPWPDSVK